MLPEHFHVVGDASVSTWEQTSRWSISYSQTCLRYPEPSALVPLPTFGQPHPRNDVCPPRKAGFGPQASVRCKGHTGCRLKCGIRLQKLNLSVKYCNRNEVAAVCLSPAHKTITSEVIT